MAMMRTQTAGAETYSYEPGQPPPGTDRQTAALKPLLVEQAGWGDTSQAALHWKSEYRLMLAVLQDVLMGWVRHRRARTLRERRLFQEISAWFWDQDRSSLYAFESICEYLELAPSAIRKGLTNWPPLSLPQADSLLQMRRVRRHKKMHVLPGIHEEE
jgi:hypothetical protein